MTEIIDLEFKTELEMKLFFSLLNNIEGLNISQLINKLGYPKTTILDNLQKLRERTIILNRYVLSYVYKRRVHRNSVGRPRTIFYISNYLFKILNNQFLIININY